MNLVDEGIDLGVLGSLDETALADATFSVEAGLNFGLGVYRGDLGACFANDGSTPLTQLNDGAWGDVLVGMTAVLADVSKRRPGQEVTQRPGKAAFSHPSRIHTAFRYSLSGTPAATGWSAAAPVRARICIGREACRADRSAVASSVTGPAW